jgi:hypothetical protein
MEFSTQSPEQKIKIGKIVNKILPVLPVAATIIPSLAPLATVVGAINRR